MSLSRRRFMSATALGASAVALAGEFTSANAQERTPLHFRILKPTQYDRTAMLQTLTIGQEHKQVFQTTVPIIIAPGIASIYIHMQNSMHAYQSSLGLGNLATLAVCTGPSVGLARND